MNEDTITCVLKIDEGRFLVGSDKSGVKVVHVDESRGYLITE